MSHDELREAARALALRLGFVTRVADGQIEQGKFDEDRASDAIRQLIQNKSDAVAVFNGDEKLALEWVERVVQESGEPDA